MAPYDQTLTQRADALAHELADTERFVAERWEQVERTLAASEATRRRRLRDWRPWHSDVLVLAVGVAASLVLVLTYGVSPWTLAPSLLALAVAALKAGSEAAEAALRLSSTLGTGRVLASIALAERARTVEELEQAAAAHPELVRLAVRDAVDDGLLEATPTGELSVTQKGRRAAERAPRAGSD
jgi:hypothetical protein